MQLDVDAQVAVDGLDRGALVAAGLESREQLAAELGNGDAALGRAGGVHDAPQLALGLRLGQAVAGALGALAPEALIAVGAVALAPPPVPGAMLLIDVACAVPRSTHRLSSP